MPKLHAFTPGMKKLIIISLFVLLLHSICSAGDFIVEFVEENYRETSSPVSYTPDIYHSIQVRSDAGPKILVLKGHDYHYRRWLRQYIAQGKQFIVQIPDDQDDLFISSSAFEMDVVNLHPFNLGLYRQGLEKSIFNKKSSLIKKKTYSRSSEKPQPKVKKENLRQKEAEKKQVLLKIRQNRVNQKKRKAALKEKAKKEKVYRQLPAQKQSGHEEQIKAELEKRRLEQERFLADLEAQRALSEQRRRKKMDKRWEELKQRLLADERLRGMERDVRNREIERRWVELQKRYGF
ncbi:MAG: hypothetical protein L3J69_09280 [Desulfobacula sp.]|nr:hypothetical protein [Desulfobacula sp.]